jgi:hypothetical protein
MQVIPIIRIVLPKRIVQVAALSQVPLQLTITLDFVPTRNEIIVTEWILLHVKFSIRTIILRPVSQLCHLLLMIVAVFHLCHLHWWLIGSRNYFGIVVSVHRQPWVLKHLLG